MMLSRRIKKVNDWAKLIIVLSLLCSAFGVGVNAQTDSDKPLNAQQLANLMTGLKQAVQENLAVSETDGKKYAAITQKWDARQDLAGKSKRQAIDLLYEDVKTVVTDAGMQYQISQVFSLYKTMPDDQFSGQTQLKSYADMTEKEKSDYVAGKIDELTTVISGKTFAFNSDFKLQVAKYVDAYAKRVGTNRKTGFFADDLNFVLQRGSAAAPAINRAFDKNGVTRLSGLYIAMIESEFDANIKSPTGSVGLFQIDNARAQKYGLALKDRSDAGKAADAAARYLKDNEDYFAEYAMTEFLAILTWNREPKKVNFDLNFKFMADSENVACPICGLVGSPNRFDKQFQTESVKYIPKFLAAAIIGENPQDFGLNVKPLSTLD